MKRALIGLLASLALLTPAAAQDYRQPNAGEDHRRVPGRRPARHRLARGRREAVGEARTAVHHRVAAGRRRHARDRGGRARRTGRLHADDDQRQSRREPERVQDDPVRQPSRISRLSASSAARRWCSASMRKCRPAPSRSWSRSPRRSRARCPTRRSGRAARAILRGSCSPPRPASACCMCPTRAVRRRSPTWSPDTSTRCSSPQ